MPDSPSDFIRDMIRADVAAGKHGGKVVTRFPARAERPPPHRSREGDLRRLRRRQGVRRALPPPHGRHEPDHRGRVVRRGDQARRASGSASTGASTSTTRRTTSSASTSSPRSSSSSAAPTSAICPTRSSATKYRGTITEAGKDSPYRTRTPDENLDSLPPDARRQVQGRREGPPREDRHVVAQHEDARPAARPHQARAPLPHRRQVVHLPALRLRPLPRGLVRGRHALALHDGVRERARALRLGHQGHRGPARPAADGVRAPQPHVHGDEQAKAPPARRAEARERLGRPAHAHDRRLPAPRLHAGVDPRFHRARRRREEPVDRRRRAPRVVRPRRPRPPLAARHVRAEAPRARHRIVPRERGRGARGPVLARGHRARGRHRRGPARLSQAAVLAHALSSTATTSSRSRPPGGSASRRAARSACATGTSSSARASSTDRVARSRVYSARTIPRRAAASPPTAPRISAPSTG